MKINLKRQKYVLPLIALPFLLLGFYLYRDTFGGEEAVVVGDDGMQAGISEASADVRGGGMADKLEAYQNTYRDADGYTAISGLGTEEEDLPQYENLYSREERRRLDSMREETGGRTRRAGNAAAGHGRETGYVPRTGTPGSDEELLRLLASLNAPQEPEQKAGEPEPMDPLAMMREQYRLMDSMEKANDPEHRAEMLRRQQRERAERETERMRLRKLTVQKANIPGSGFNTISRQRENGFIKAIIDEDVKGYAGSRIRIRLLEDIRIGRHTIRKGSYLYALINGFSEQRVTLQIVSVMHQDRVLPVSLSIYDLDGMEGLYVPASAFREFSKDLGATTMQGMDMSGNGANQQDFFMSAIEKTMQSTSAAIAKAIRKNRAKFKYNTFVYLIDKQELEEQQNQNNPDHEDIS